MRSKYAGELILYDQTSPSQEVHQPGDNVGYRADSPTTYTHSPDDKKGLPKGEQLPNQHHDEANPPTSRVTQNGVTDFVQGEMTYPKRAALISDVMAKVSQDVIEKANRIQPSISRVLPGKGFWSFSVNGSKGNKYSVRLKVQRKGNAKSVDKHHVQISCNCNFFRWQGPEHWAKANNYLYGKPVGTASKPDVRDPNGKHWLCKHAVAVLNKARTFRFANDLALNLTGATIEPAPSAAIVARRYAAYTNLRK
jgi:hypothetical protein